MSRRGINPRAILFDLDGTLLDTYEGITRSVMHALEKVGAQVPSGDDLGWVIGPPLEASFAKILGSLDAKLIRHCMTLYRERYEKDGLYESSVYPGIEEALDELSHDADLYLATAKPREYGYQALDAYGLLPYFKAVHGSEFDGTHSDKEELIAHVLKRERIAPQTALMIGDRKYDVIGAKVNGVTSVGVTWGFGTKHELINAGAKYLAEYVHELPEIERLSSSRARSRAWHARRA